MAPAHLPMNPMPISSHAGAGAPASPAPMSWDIALTKTLRHGDARFELDLRFVSTAQRLVLHGPSGAGKTQTLRLIAGISQPDAGRVVVAGRVLYDAASGVALPAQARRLGYVFQDYALFPHLTVRHNIAFALRSGWLNPRGRARQPAAERWIEAFHLQAVADHYPHQISGGQRQRTALARALVHEPSALLLDEPFAALDLGLRRQLRAELCELQAQLRIPTLLITHDDDDARALGDQVVQVRAGRVVEGAAAPEPAHG
jgi:molybdate transport system ATP-binding protein